MSAALAFASEWPRQAPRPAPDGGRRAAPSAAPPAAAPCAAATPVAVLCGALALAAPAEGSRRSHRRRRLGGVALAAVERESTIEEKKRIDELRQKVASAKEAAEKEAAEAATRPPSIAVCGFGEGSGGSAQLVASLLTASGAEPLFVDLERAEGAASALEGCEVLVLCPDSADSSSKQLQRANELLETLSVSLPKSVEKLLLVSRSFGYEESGGFDLGSIFGSPASWKDIERTVERMGQYRSLQLPLRILYVRAGQMPAGGAPRQVVKCTLQEPEGVPEGSTCTTTSPEGVANSVLVALKLGVDASFFIREEEAPPSGAQECDWKEMMLPLIGPELFRAPVGDAKSCVKFIHDFAKAQEGMKVATTPSGAICKFRLFGKDTDTPFDKLDQGGLEFRVEDDPNGGYRLRAIRCAKSKRGGYTNDGGLLKKFKDAFELAKMSPAEQKKWKERNEFLF